MNIEIGRTTLSHAHTHSRLLLGLEIFSTFHMHRGQHTAFGCLHSVFLSVHFIRPKSHSEIPFQPPSIPFSSVDLSRFQCSIHCISICDQIAIDDHIYRVEIVFLFMCASARCSQNAKKKWNKTISIISFAAKSKI